MFYQPQDFETWAESWTVYWLLCNENDCWSRINLVKTTVFVKNTETVSGKPKITYVIFSLSFLKLNWFGAGNNEIEATDRSIV